MLASTTMFSIVRWGALLWLLTWLPLNIWAWGWQNMLHICDVGVIVACIGLGFRQRLLVASQALLAPFVGLFCSFAPSRRDIVLAHALGAHACFSTA